MKESMNYWALHLPSSPTHVVKHLLGRGKNTSSYVPVIAEDFVSGRTWLDEAPNDPAFCDLAQITGMEMDGKSFEEIVALIQHAKGAGLWLVLAGHDIGEADIQTTEVEMPRETFALPKEPGK